MLIKVELIGGSKMALETPTNDKSLPNVVVYSCLFMFTLVIGTLYSNIVGLVLNSQR